MVNTPVSVSDPTRPRYLDYYIDACTYDRWSYEYDGEGDLTTLRAPGEIMQTAYTDTSDGQVSPVTRGTGGAFTYAYDGDGNLTKKTPPNGMDTDYFYDSTGHLTKRTHPSVGANGHRWAYDGTGQVTSATTPQDATTTYAYDTVGNLTSETDFEGNTSTFAYDHRGRLTQQTDPVDSVTYAVDALGQMPSVPTA